MRTKKTIILASEIGRVRGRTSVEIIILEDNLEIYRTSFDFSTGSNRELESESINYLVGRKKLDKEMVNDGGYFLRDKKDFTLVVIEGRGLNYVTVFD